MEVPYLWAAVVIHRQSSSVQRRIQLLYQSTRDLGRLGTTHGRSIRNQVAVLF